LVIGGFAVYFVGLTIGGWLQGLAMLDAARPFMDSVNITKPYLLVRTIGGTLMTLGHLVFALHVAMMLMRRGDQRSGATLLRRRPGTPMSSPIVVGGAA
jgi:cytochrome c oxidase cbb3-type subunit 1